jgi:hypothetical protein
MSNALALSAVTAVLQSRFNTVFNQPSSALGTVLVSAVAPDIVQAALGASGAAPLRVNLFLHQVTPNAAWRNAGFPSLGPDGATRLTNPPLALDLHYLLTAYASEDTEAEALLGTAILLLHENPILARAEIRAALAGLSSTAPLATVLSSSGLADQFEMIKIAPATLGREEMAWLWTALKADYRPTFPFQVSVVLIQPQLPAAASLPVLSRGITAQPSVSLAQLRVQLPTGQQSAAPGDTITLSGDSTTGAGAIGLSNQRLGIQYPPFAPLTNTGAALTFAVPNDPANLPAGAYDVTVTFSDGSLKVLRIPNSLPIAPTILSTPAPTAAANTAGTLVTISCNPQVRPNQIATLLLGTNTVTAQPFTAATGTLTFQFSPALASGNHLVRLQVDETVSPVAVNWTATPPVFTGPMVKV